MSQLLCNIERSSSCSDFTECVTIRDVLYNAKSENKCVTFLLDYADACEVIRECLKKDTLIPQYIEISNPEMGGYEGMYLVTVLDNGNFFVEEALNEESPMFHETDVLFVGESVDNYVSVYAPHIYSKEYYEISLAYGDVGEL